MEGKEAEFFGSYEELVEKVRYYLQNPERRKRIAVAGRHDVSQSGYSNHERLKWAFEQLAHASHREW